MFFVIVRFCSKENDTYEEDIESIWNDPVSAVSYCRYKNFWNKEEHEDKNNTRTYHFSGYGCMDEKWWDEALKENINYQTFDPTFKTFTAPIEIQY